MKKEEKIDLIVLLIYPIFGALFSHVFNVNAFGSVIIFLGLPSIYLTIRGSKYAKKAMVFSLILGIPSIIMIDYIAHLTGQWIVPNSVLSYRLLGFVTIEVILWAVFNCYFVIMFYEYFLDKHVTKKLWHPHMKYLLVLVLFSLIIFMITYFYLPSKLNIPYFYLVFGVFLLLIPMILELFAYPKLISKFVMTGAYFFI